MNESLQTIQMLYAAFEKDAQCQLLKGNKAAGARARKNALKLGKELKDFRKKSLEFDPEGKEA